MYLEKEKGMVSGEIDRRDLNQGRGSVDVRTDGGLRDEQNREEKSWIERHERRVLVEEKRGLQ